MNNLWIELVVNGLLARHERGAAMLIQCLKREVEECHEQIAALEAELRFLRHELECERARTAALITPDAALDEPPRTQETRETFRAKLARTVVRPELPEIDNDD